ncbi:AMP-binding protein [Clostridioides sp. ZZV14-6345]|uniref:AMP-binding protein n=1 Tax=Clostridioides sp. ZZV14-6345 TaxID=2811496 RepID=UPI001D11CA0A|nr:AMP-binding protein [Clostridioides sp. ZZV14-6345]
MNYYELLKIKKNIHKNKDFLIIDGEKYTYENVLSDSEELGKQISIGENIPILIYSKNIMFQLLSFFAINYSKNIPIICHYNLSKKVLNDILLKNHISIIISDESMDTIDLFGNNDDEGLNEVNFSVLNPKFNIHMYQYKNPMNYLDKSICMGALSSGSTSVPKVLYRTYESWAGFFPIQNGIFNISEESILFINGTLSFTGNLNSIMSVLYEGGSVVISSGLNCKSWIKTIKQYNISNIYLIPTKLQLLVKHLKEPIHKIVSIFTGSQLLFEDTAKNLKKYMPESEIILYYGASELNYITYLCYDELIEKPLSVGRAFPGIDVYIREGKIFVNTEYAVYNSTKPYSVNDVGYFDDDGYLIFEGRNDDIVNIGGFKVSSTKIENEVKKIPQIEDAVVLPYSDSIRGKQIVLFVTTIDKITRKDLLIKMRNNLMKNEIPRRIIFLNSFPYTSSEKIDRLALLKIL